MAILESENHLNEYATSCIFKSWISGSGIKVDILNWNETTHIGIIKVPQSELIIFWGSLVTYQFSMSGEPCAFDILDNSACVISLANNSRDDFQF
ncbi:unnamed protein product [Cunninghamella blakesleeana]